MRIDAHQHFWNYNPKEYSWINEDMAILKKDFLPEDLHELIHQNNFDSTIAVQARQSVAETDWLLKLASRYSFIQGVIGWVDLRANDIHARLKVYSAEKKLVGFRHVLQDEPDDDFMLQPDFLHGISRLGEFAFTYDLLIFPRHLKNSIQMVRKFPNQVFILDHLGKPDIKNKIISPWKEGIEEIASCQKVYCKLSGMVTEANLLNWKEEDFGLYLDIVTKAFGTGRLIYGSDWPVCSLGGSYAQIRNIVTNYFKDFPNKEQQMVFGENAARVYNLQ